MKFECVDYTAYCGLGISIEKINAAVEAGIDCFQQTPISFTKPIPITSAFLCDESLPPINLPKEKEMSLPARLARMLRISSLPLQKISEQVKIKPVILYLGLPEQGFINSKIINTGIFDLLSAQTDVEIDRDKSKLFPYGRSAGIAALHQAMQYLEMDPNSEIIVGGIDSFLDMSLLATLDAEDRLLCEGAMDAFVPGEAAGFIRLGVATESNEKTVYLYPPGLAKEKGYRYNLDEPYKGEGLAQAITSSLQQCPENAIKNTFCSMNGESFGNKEWGVSALRNSSYFADKMTVHHPAEFFGEIGAAFAPVLIGLASMHLVEQSNPEHALVWCSSELEARASVLLSST